MSAVLPMASFPDAVAKATSGLTHLLANFLECERHSNRYLHLDLESIMCVRLPLAEPPIWHWRTAKSEDDITQALADGSLLLVFNPADPPSVATSTWTLRSKDHRLAKVEMTPFVCQSLCADGYDHFDWDMLIQLLLDSLAIGGALVILGAVESTDVPSRHDVESWYLSSTTPALWNPCFVSRTFYYGRPIETEPNDEFDEDSEDDVVVRNWGSFIAGCQARSS
ncbi:hypothetical protein FA15DRAFT_655602 [Coprinopsis marcescibilis]|uniref:Uncharacterized protein n=1 Tax=Coprinopsis marcescibilis TaxID=230819 RepID=A0A5C3KWK1_COPMA|nr:hypothetical protein FA15DRAFT_655602 [Coprinopsis marcescibilis]